MNIASLFATFGIKLEKSSLAATDKALAKTRDAAQKTADKIAGAFQDARGRWRENNGRFVARNGAMFKQLADGANGAAARVRTNWGEMWKGMKKDAGSFFAFAQRGFMVAGIGLATLYGAGKVGDSYTGARSKINGMTDDVPRQIALQEKLFNSAQATATEYGDVVSLYQQVGKAAIDSGRSLEQGADIVDTINKAIKSSGASADGASAALTQLAQGLGSGTLRGEEFNSVLEQAPVLIDLIAKDMGKTRGEMRKLAEGGKITGKAILGALERQKGAIDEAYAKRLPQVGDLFVRLKNQASKSLSEMFQRKEIVEGLTSVFKGLTTAMLVTIKVIAAVGSYFAKHTTQLKLLLAAIAAAYIYMGVSAAAAWLAALWPIALVIAAIAAFIYFFEDLVGIFFAGMMHMVDGVMFLWRKFRQFIDKIKSIGRAIRDFFKGVASAIRGFFVGVFDWLLNRLNWVIGKLNWLIDKLNWVINKLNWVPGVDIPTAGKIEKFNTRSNPATRTFGQAFNITAGETTINVQSQATDPVAVANETRAALKGFWDSQMRDAFAGTGGNEGVG